MSVFDNHLNSERIDKESDNLILKRYRISNSGATLIPKENVNDSDNDADIFGRMRSRRIRARRPKIIGLTFKEESSIFNMFNSHVCKLTPEEQKIIYNTYLNIIRDMGLKCLVYNQKRYYQINREGKRKIAYALFKNKNNSK